MYPICVSIADSDIRRVIRAVKSYPLVELRLDSANFSEDEISNIVANSHCIVATCRPGKHSLSKRKKLMLAAIKAGATMIDIEIEAPTEYRKALQKAAKIQGTKVILSYHNFKLTPPANQLSKIVTKCRKFGADIVKVATQIKSHEDNEALLHLLGRKERLVIIGMGEQGVATRVVAPMLGSMFTFAAMARGKETAPGQLDVVTLKKVYKELGFLEMGN